MAVLLDTAHRRVALHASLPCDLSAVRGVVARMRAFLEEQGLPSDDAAGCELVLAEACNNAIEHACPQARSLPVQVEVIVDAQTAELRVEDRTPGFEWPDPVRLPADDSERGRGLFLIRSLSDEATYLRGADRNVLVMKKRRRRPADVEDGSADPEQRCRELERKLQEDERVIRDMADELSSCYESLAAIFRYSGEQSRSDTIDDFARRLLGDLLRVTGNDWYVFRLLEIGSNRLTVFASSEPSVFLQPLELAAAGRTPVPLELQAVAARRDTWFEHTDRLAPGDSLARLFPGSGGLVHPVYLGDNLVGTLAVGGKTAGRRFTAAQMSVVQTFADFLAIQIVNARFQEERVRNLLVAQELRIAEHIQRSLLPETLPQPIGMALAGACESASEVGGDFYDVIPLSDATVLVVVGDVMGKGLPAAMFALILRSLVRALRDFGPRPAMLLSRANELLHDELSKVEMFITTQVAYVDAASGHLTLASAGHCPALVAGGTEGPVRALSPEGMPLGVMPDAVFMEECIPIEPGMRCLLYTDGVTETGAADNGGLFGQKRLEEWFGAESLAGHPPEVMKAALVQTLARFRAQRTLGDDQTFVIIGR